MRKFLPLFILVLAALSNCKKDVSFSCIPIPTSKSIFGWNYASDSNFNEAPSYNPNNSNKFAFLQQTTKGTTLCTYDIKSNIILKLYTGNIFYKPDWGITDWILFDVNNDVYKIKSNGDSLTQITTGGISCNPKWNPDASKFIYNLFAGSGYNGTLVSSANGNIIDSLDFSFGATSAWIGNTIADGGA